MNKSKKDEKIVLEWFIKIYKERIDSNTRMQILDVSRAKPLFPDYNGENPDFIILFNDEYIGIELFKLIGRNIEKLNLMPEEETIGIKNVAHLYSRREKTEKKAVYLQEDLVRVALDRINDKIKNKLSNYIACPIWLIGYANEPFNIHLLSPYFEYKEEGKLVNYIRARVIKSERIKQIWLAELSGNELLLRIK